MKLKGAFLLALPICTVFSSAHAQEVWTCSYATPPTRPLMVRFRESGDILIDEKFQQQFRILKNNSYGLIAASSTSEIEPNQTKPTIGAEVIIINKRTNEILSLSGILGHPEVSMPYHGTCIKG